MNAEQQAEVESAMMEEVRWFLEEAVRVSAKQQARAEDIRFERERQVKARQKASNEEAGTDE